ncbi:MAG: hypothetical protein ACT4P1_12345 [Sporichthyaceae bacterium]
MTNETTPLYDALIAEVGNPIITPAVDRSYRAVVAQSEMERSASASVPAPASARKPVSAAARKTAAG